MFCQRCRKEMPAGAQFCLSCGSRLAAADAAGAPVVAEAPASDPKRKQFLILGVALGLAFLAVVGVLIAVLMNRPGQSVTVQPTAPPPTSPSVTAAPSVQVTPGSPTAAPAPVTPGAPTTAPAAHQPPADVVAYLAWLQGIEQRRQGIDTQSSSALMSLGPALTGGLGALKGLTEGEDFQPPDNTQAKQAWQDLNNRVAGLIAEFEKNQQVPASCQTLHAQYRGIFEPWRQVFQAGSQAIQAGDPSAIMSVAVPAEQQKVARCQTAEQELANVCTKNGITKGWSIQGGGGSTGGLTGAPQ